MREPLPAPCARGLVWGDSTTRPFHFARTVRSLGHVGLKVEELPLATPRELGALLADAVTPVWLVRAGCWPAPIVTLPAPSATGRPLCALGAQREVWGAAGTEDTARWADAVAATGGDLKQLLLRGSLPPLASVFLEPPLAQRVGERLEREGSLAAAVAATSRELRARVVRVESLDVHDDPGLRIAQVVTSLQRGGAERVAIDLTHALPHFGITTRLIALGGPTRRPFASPEQASILTWEGLSDREARSARLIEEVLAFGADIAHVHLLEANDVARLAAAGPPVALAVHNVRPGWAAGTERLRASDAALLVACSRAVEADLRAADVPVPARTVWNGIDVEVFRPTPERLAEAREWRIRLGLGADDFVLLAVANPRPQKRLHVLPAILQATRERFARVGIGREVRLLLAGEASRGSADARQSVRVLRAEIEARALSVHTHLLGGVDDLAPLLLAADVIVSPSAYEGLSLAHLEALAAGRPVVATAVGGTPEVARESEGLRLLPPDASPDAWAEALEESVASPTEVRLPPSFTRARMAEGCARLYAGLLAGRSRSPRRGLLLVTNNFSVGGAQTSARRLLTTLHADGIPVQAVVVEEQPAFPTPGRRALRAVGIPTAALPPPGTIDPQQAVQRILEGMEGDPPAAVLLWNVIPEYKVLLADALLDVPLYDVSPGEMYYASFDRYLAKPRPGLPYRALRDYGARLAGVIVKYAGEEACAASRLGAPVHVIRNGVPCPEEGPPRRGAPGRLVLGTAARLDPRKKVHELIEALRLAHDRLPPYVLRIAGGVERGEDEYAWRLLDHARGLNVEWRGEIDDAGPFLRGLDAFVLVAEPAGCPNASLEAMADGLPVIATDVGGMSEQVVNGVTGALVPPGDSAALAEAIVALAHDPETRARMGAAAHARVRERFDVVRMAADYRRICLGIP